MTERPDQPSTKEGCVANLAPFANFAVKSFLNRKMRKERKGFAKVGCRPPGGNVRYSAHVPEHVLLSAIADAVARRSTAYLVRKRVDGLGEGMVLGEPCASFASSAGKNMTCVEIAVYT